MSELAFRLARAYVRLYGVVKDRFGRDLPGLGWAARRIRRPRVLAVHGRAIAFEPALAGAYGRLIAGQWNELETHRFLHHMLRATAGDVTFVDVGASVGAMVADLAADPRVRRVLAFEPHAATAANLARTAALNGWDHVEVRALALGGAPGSARLVFDATAPTAAHLAAAAPAARPAEAGGPAPAPAGAAVAVSTLDLETAGIDGPALLLIDVEGAEPDVIRGGAGFIRRARPVIVFEYNEISRRHFTLAAVTTQLGPGYAIWRLRIDGTLDREFDAAWNCVAVPSDTAFAAAARPLVRGGGAG
jgi:FkbM family methyltransferase